jgi:hypothetical protein
VSGLEPGWLQREFKDIDALERAQKKIMLADAARRRNGYTQPSNIEFTTPELKALAYMVRCVGVAK